MLKYIFKLYTEFYSDNDVEHTYNSNVRGIAHLSFSIACRLTQTPTVLLFISVCCTPFLLHSRRWYRRA